MKQKSENRKAMPKFILIVAGSLLLGIVLGVAMVFGDGSWTAVFGENIMKFLLSAAPWLLLTSAFLAAALMLLLYHKAKNMFSSWQEEDEATLQKIDHLLTIAMQINSVFVILSYFFVAIPMGNIQAYSMGDFFFCLGAFILELVVMLIGQQKLVDFAKKLYPEKRGSVYDVKFQKVWFESCDEAERAIIGQAAFAAYKSTNSACLLIWLFLILANVWFEIGLMPIAVVTVIWLVSSLSYFFKTMQLEKNSNGINGVFPY